MKTDERQLLHAVARGEKPFEAALCLDMHAKRLEYLCDKWARKGWFDCGVSNRQGWLTERGLEAARSTVEG